MPDLPPRPAHTPPRAVGDLLERLPGARVEGSAATTVTGVTHDSRHVRAGDLYIARAGEVTHGIEHVDAAVAAGAAAVLTDPGSAAKASAAGVPAVVVVADPRAAMGPAAAWVYGDPAAELLLIGVTGTNGKTTTVYLVDAGLRAAGRTTGLIGTIETRVAGDVLPSARTTPEATDLHALFALMRERGVDAVSMEVSSHALALGRVDGIRFDLAGFTNLSQDHLDFHRDMADYFAAKASLFTEQRASRGIVCTDDQWGEALARDASIPVTTTGLSEAADWRRTDEVDEGLAGSYATLVSRGGESDVVRSGLIGHVNLANAALAYLTLRAAGVDAEVARDGVAGLRAVPGRMEPVDAGQPFAVLVDYAHTPAAVTSLLDAAHGLAAADGRVLVVLGCGGERDRLKRPQMGAAAANGADIAVLTSDNPRSEDPDEILVAMREGVPAGRTVEVVPDRRQAIARVVGLARAGDVVVIAGKGHEQGQDVGGRVLPFDDRKVARDAIAGAARERAGAR